MLRIQCLSLLEHWEDRRPGLTNSAANQSQIQQFEEVHPNIYFKCELLECVMGADPSEPDVIVNRVLLVSEWSCCGRHPLYLPF